MTTTLVIRTYGDGEVAEWLKAFAWKADIGSQNSIEGSNPSFSAMAVLDGELAVPCNSKSAMGRSKTYIEGLASKNVDLRSGVDT